MNLDLSKGVLTHCHPACPTPSILLGTNDPMFKTEHKHVHQFKMCTCFVLFCKRGKNALSCYKLLLSHDPATHIFVGYLLDISWIISRFSKPGHTTAVFVSTVGSLRCPTGSVTHGWSPSCDGQAEPSSCKMPKADKTWPPVAMYALSVDSATYMYIYIYMYIHIHI